MWNKLNLRKTFLSFFFSFFFSFSLFIVRYKRIARNSLSRWTCSRTSWYMEGEKEEEEEDSLKIFTKEERCWCKKIMNIEYCYWWIRRSRRRLLLTRVFDRNDSCNNKRLTWSFNFFPSTTFTLRVICILSRLSLQYFSSYYNITLSPFSHNRIVNQFNNPSPRVINIIPRCLLFSSRFIAVLSFNSSPIISLIYNMYIIPFPRLVIYAVTLVRLARLLTRTDQVRAVIINIGEGKEDEVVESRIETWFPEWEKRWRD